VEIEYRVRDRVPRDTLMALFRDSWEGGDHAGMALEHSLTWITAHDGDRLVGFVNVAWDGKAHAFLLDTTVHPTVRRRGIGAALVRLAAEEARRSGVEWLHVDYEERLRGFYERCGFKPTSAGLQRLREATQP
jgi:GNAT superfamily N-acetyltransferase